MSIKPEDPHKIMTIERHILDEQRQYPEATGTLTQLLYDIALAGKVIASRTTRAGLAEILGQTEDINIQGEVVQKLDRFADLIIYRLNDHTGRLAVLASEENEHPLPIPEKYPCGKYVLLYDPLDGSSNIDYNLPIGTIFSIYRRKSEQGPGYFGGLSAARSAAGGRGLYPVWLQHHAGLFSRAGCARFYPGSIGR